jgi:hypothetical protein
VFGQTYDGSHVTQLKVMIAFLIQSNCLEYIWFCITVAVKSEMGKENH